MKHAATPVLLLCLCGLPPLAVAGTTTTTYSYNADGALTAMRVQADGSDAATTYLTWDNFTPDALSPDTGTLHAADGRLLALGAAPGGAAQFGFDRRGLLTAQGAGDTDQAYGYHANGLLASADLGDQARAFYQGHGKHPRMLNIAETANGSARWSARLGAGRYLSDGTEQVLMSPRKDTAGVFSPADGALAGQDYDPFGAQPEGTPVTGYDLADNPFQYAGEYRDPLWGGVYLRARWYDPNLAQFISRDPMPHLNRYGYGGGNPVMHLDPGGMNFFHSLNADLNKGWWGHLDRFFLAPIMAPLAIAADPKGFWQQIKHNKGGIDIYLAAGVAVELASMGAEGFGLSETVRTLGVGKRFGFRLLVDSGLGLGQAVAVGHGSGTHQFNWSGFAASAEMTFGGLSYSRLALGEGYHPYTLKGEDVAARVEAMTDNNKLLVFRERTQGYAPWRGHNTSPLAEWLGIGSYHERLVAVSREDFASNELVVSGGGSAGLSGSGSGASGLLAGVKQVSMDFDSEDDLSVLKMNSDKQTLRESFAGRRGRYQFVGEIDRSQLSTFARANPHGYPQIEVVKAAGADAPGASQYRLLSNNCQHHAAAVLRLLSLR